MPRPFQAMLALMMALFFLAPAGTARAQDERCFAETNHCISGQFLRYWEQHGGLAVFGYPITPARQEQNRDTGRTHLTQWFERNRFELHPEQAAPYDVLLGRLGDDRLLATGRDWRAEPMEAGPRDGCLWFPETSHNVCDQENGRGFRQYWQTHGLQDPRLNQYQRSLALFGLPLTEPRVETNSSGDSVLTQWFERARFEWHPDKPTEFKVLLGRLGSDAQDDLVDSPRPTGRIVYVSSPGVASGGDLYISNADGSGQRRITTTDALSLERAEYAVSPAGDRLVYVLGTTLYVIGIDGRGQQVVAAAPGITPDFEMFSPTWSPDGSYVAFVLNNDVYASKADGSAPVQITRSGDVIRPGCLSWARNGSIGYLKSGRSTNQIWVVRSDGSGMRQVGWGLCPALSPAGDRIAFRHGGDIGLLTLDDGGARVLTANRNIVRLFWSPDGSRLLAAEDGDLIVVDAATGTVRDVTSGSANDGRLTWSPDGAFIAFTTHQDQRYSLAIVTADGQFRTLLHTPQPSASPQWIR